jgi:hypothetical protein
MNLQDILGSGFNPEEAAAAETPAFEKVPEGDYRALVESAEIRATKDGQGEELALRLIVQGGGQGGALIFDSPVLRHPKAGRQFYGRKRFAQLLLAADIRDASDAEALIGAEVMLNIIHDGTYANVSEYWEVPRRPAQRPAAAAPKPAPASPTSTVRRPAPKPQPVTADADFDDDIPI